MITILKSADNSGFKKIKYLGYVKNNKKFNINNVCVAVINKCTKNPKFVKKSDIIKTLIVRVKKYNFNIYKGTKFYNNSAILIDPIEFEKNKKIKIKSTKLTGIISSIIRPYIYRSKINIKKAMFI